LSIYFEGILSLATVDRFKVISNDVENNRIQHGDRFEVLSRDVKYDRVRSKIGSNDVRYDHSSKVDYIQLG
jgi:hypothetical protein